MRRQQLLPLKALWHRWASSLSNLVAAQTQLQEGKKLSRQVAKDFTEFFNVPVPQRKSADECARAYFAAVQRQSAEDQGKRVVREQVQHQSADVELAVFLLGYSFKRRTIVLYSVSADRTVIEHKVGADAWGVADSLLQHTNGMSQFILLPVVTSQKDRRLLQPVTQDFVKALRGSGLQPICHVDTLEMAETLTRSPPDLADTPADSAGAIVPPALSDGWFRAYWVLLRTLACKAADGDPLHTVCSYILPRYDVYVVHLVRAGSRSMNASIWDPVRRRRFAAKGMLSDILACLFSTRSTQFILVPTNRTDRAMLFRCRTALVKTGSKCVLVFASEVDETFRRVFNSDPSRYWSALRDAGGGLDADVLTQICSTAGNTMRTYHRKLLLEGKDKGMLDARRELEAKSTGDEELDETASLTQVEKWLKVFESSKRRASEAMEERVYRKYVAFAFTCTEYADYGQPRNPLSPQNYIVSASVVDHSGKVLEPWRKFSGRRQFELPCLDGYDVIVVHGVKQFLLLQGCDGTELKEFLMRGGRVWCTMLAEYLLDAQRTRTGSNTINDIALKYGFLLPPPALLGSHADDLPLAFHRQHLIPAVSSVAAIFKQQLHRAVEQSQLVSLAHRMDSLLAMTWMEWAGVRVDAHEADRQAKMLRSATALLDRSLNAFVPPEVPLDMRAYFDWESHPQMHAFFFGGTITLGHGSRARASRKWTSNLVHLCHRFGPFAQMVGELHLQRFASEHEVRVSVGASSPAEVGGRRLPQRIAAHIEKEGSHKQKKYRLVLLDVETTGLNVTTDEIIEVAMFDPVENTSFTSLVNPQRRISPRTIEIHHITDEAVKDAPALGQVMEGVVDYLRLSPALRDPNEIVVLLGHNVFSLDEPMLRRAFTTSTTDVEHDSILFCDTLVLLKALKAELQNSGQREKKSDPAVLETLTSSLRLSKLVEKLRVTPTGQLHRADTDTKALWFVLVAAFGLAGQTPEKQRDAVLTEAAKSLLLYPAVGAFVPSERKLNTQLVELPGITRDALGPLTAKQIATLKSKPFSEQVLEVLSAHGIKVAGLLLQRMRLSQHSSRFLQSGSGSTVTVMHPDGAVHQHIDMTATTTSRTTSAYPSLQNIPKDDKSSVRRLFVSRFGAEGRCVEIDYSQLEIVVLAILCRDPNLMKDLNSGLDFHIKRAEFFSGLPYKEIYEGYRRDVPKYVKLRKTAKQFSFQRLYGAGIPLLHKTTGIPAKDLEASIKMEDKAYPGIAEFHRVARRVALRANNPGLPTNFIVEMPTGLRMSFRTQDVILNLPPLKNYPIQGYGAELAQMMVGRVFRHFVKKSFYSNKAFLTNFVHDSVWLDCHMDVLQDCVQDTVRILSDVHRYVPSRFPGVEICVPLKVTSSCGIDMCNMQSVKDGNFSVIYKQQKSKSSLTAADLLSSLPASPLSPLRASAAAAAAGEIKGSAWQDEEPEKSETPEDSAALDVVEDIQIV